MDSARLQGASRQRGKSSARHPHKFAGKMGIVSYVRFLLAADSASRVMDILSLGRAWHTLRRGGCNSSGKDRQLKSGEIVTDFPFA
jgi:hypothetical protein